MEAMRAGLLDQRVDHRIIEYTGLLLQLLPVNRRLYRVGVQTGGQRPDLWQRSCPGTRVMDLRAQNKIWFPVEHEGVVRPVMGDLRQRMGLRPQVRGIRAAGSQQEKQWNRGQERESTAAHEPSGLRSWI